MKNYNLYFRRIARQTPARFGSLGESSRSSAFGGHRARSNLQRPTQVEMLRFVLLVMLSLTLTVGCGPRQNVGEVEKAVLEFDSSFKDVLAKKADLDSQIDLIMGEFRKKQGEINSKIMELEEELKVIRRQAYSQVRELKTQLNPERQRIALKLSEFKANLKTKVDLLRTLRDSLKETQKLVKKNKDLGLSQEEEAKWEKNLNDISSQIPPLEDEIATLRREIDIYRQELNLLKQ